MSSYVKKVIHVPSGKLMAVKVISMASEAVNRNYLARELIALHHAECPYCVDFYGATSYVEGFCCSMLMDRDIFNYSYCWNIWIWDLWIRFASVWEEQFQNPFLERLHFLYIE